MKDLARALGLTTLLLQSACAVDSGLSVQEVDGGIEECGEDCEMLNSGESNKTTGVSRFRTRYPVGKVVVACRFGGEVRQSGVNAQGARVIDGPNVHVDGTLSFKYSGLAGTITMIVPNSCTLGSYSITQSRSR